MYVCVCVGVVGHGHILAHIGALMTRIHNTQITNFSYPLLHYDLIDSDNIDANLYTRV